MKRNSVFKDLQHQFRGIVAKTRSSGFSDVKTSSDIAENYYYSLKTLLLRARMELGGDQYRPFIQWISSQESSLLGAIKGLPKGYEHLYGVANSKPAALVTEIHWSTTVLERQLEAICQFRRAADEICQLVLRDEFLLAIEKLDTIDESWGVSLWSLQLRIALTNEAFGLEEQKKVVADARAIFKRGLLGFVAYHCGVRNESRATAERFSLTTERRIAEHRYFSEEVKAFLRHHLLGQFPDSHSGMADVLRVSQSHHFFDLYEDLICVLQALCFKPIPDNLRIYILEFLQLFGGIGDFRIDKLKYAYQVYKLDLSCIVKNTILNAICVNSNWRALREFTNYTSRNLRPNPWDVIYSGWVISEGRLKDPKERRMVRRCVRFVAATFMSTDLFDPHDATTKLARNFSQLPFFRALRQYSDLINASSFSAKIDHRVIGLNSPVFGIEDLGNTDIHQIAADQSFGRGAASSAVDFWAAFTGQGYIKPDDSELIRLANSVGISLRCEQSALPGIPSLDVGRNTLGARNFFSDFVTLKFAQERYQKGDVLSLLSTACSSAVYSPFRHKILEATKGYTWEHYEKCGDPVLRSVAIRMVWQQCGDTKLLSVLRFSIKKFFSNPEYNVPSKIDWERNKSPKSAVLFFLNSVCTTDVLDILSDLRGTRHVLEERSRICLLLQRLDPINSHLYASELEDIQADLSFADGQLIVDSSRIYVETPHLRQWAKINLSEDYSRLRDLAELDKENSLPFDELLAEIRRGQRELSAPFLPESEADVLRYSILHRLRDEFLTNPTFGLDFFLSKRIRHQSFIGSIRAPLELEEIITNRSDEGSQYKPNEKWVSRLSESNAESRKLLFAAFKEFSEAFDERLLESKDKYFQVLGREKPKGLIFLPLTSNIIELSKSLSPIDSSFESFMDTAITLLWVGLEPALGLTRSYISEELKYGLIGEINTLRSKVRETIGYTSEFLEFDAAIGKRSSEVQVKLDECAGWFARTNLDFTEKTFSLSEAIGMAQVFALSCLPGFDPIINAPVVYSETQILAPSLVHIHDQVLIALQNAKEHSGLRNPRVKTEAKIDTQASVLRIRIESEIRPSALEKARDGAAERKRLIAEGKSKFETRKEGGSGFFKLAAVASQSSKGRLEFGVTAAGMFFLEVQYSLIVEDGGW